MKNSASPIRGILVTAILLLFAISSNLFAQTINTIAGNGTIGFSGDGGPATSAQFSYPFGITLDNSNNIFFADINNHRIRKINSITGIITTVAGNGIGSYAGDGGLATSARLNSPASVAVDALGNLFISDQNNHRIRKVDGITGIITTLAGTGIDGFSGDGGLATSAKINTPFGLSVDASGNIFFTDVYNSRIRRIDAITNIITTVAGNGVDGYSGDGGLATSAALYNPTDVKVDATGNLFIADYINQRIRKVDFITGIISTVAGTGVSGFSGDGGLATSAKIAGESGVTVDAIGNIYLTSQGNQRIRKVDIATGFISTIAGTGVSGFSGDGGLATSAQLNFPSAIAVDAFDNIYFTDQSNQRIRKITTCIAPSISVQPNTPIATCNGSGSQIISVTASGTNLTYQWRKSGIAISNGAVISGATTNVLTLTSPAISDASNYDVVITNICGTITSNSVVVSVNPLPTITSTNTPQVRCGAGVVNLTATSSIASSTFNWYSAASGGASLFTGANYSPSITANTTYYVATTSPQGCTSVSRTPVVASVGPVYTANTSQCVNGNSFTFYNGCEVLGATYKWNFGDNSPIVTSLTNTSQTHSYATAGNYQVTLITTLNGIDSYSSIFISVNPMPVADFSIHLNTGNGSSYTFQSSSTIQSGNMNYSWSLGANSSPSSSIVISPQTYLFNIVALRMFN